jgi:glyoxylase-like metal-dependent hydrolase (beta-lactamase superfamily II)
MCKQADGQDHSGHEHPHEGHAHKRQAPRQRAAQHLEQHPHDHDRPVRLRNHVPAETGSASRRDFLRLLMGGALSGAGILELAYHRAAWARTAAKAGSDETLFDLQQAADGVFLARAKPQTVINCNAAIFVRSQDVVVVDAHAKPSAASALIAQIKREVTTKPVRYVINSHFHLDHTQGNHAYRGAEPKIDFIATEATKKSMEELAVIRLKASVDEVPSQIEALRKEAEKAESASEKAFCAGEIEHLKAYQAEMQDYVLELPTITFEKSYELKDRAFDLHLEFHGHAHTAGDVFVLCPQQRAIATGDASHGWLPYIFDGFPKSWPKTIDSIAQADFAHVLGGHGPLQNDRTVMMSQRNYIEELTERVEQARAAGQTVAEMQQRITVESMRSLQSNGYAEFLLSTQATGHPYWGPASTSLQSDVNENIGEVFKNLDRV